jgi:hypothetical protein
MRGNTTVNSTGSFPEPLKNVSMLEFEIYSWSRAGAFVKITSALDNFIAEYDGDDIVNMSILEEAEGSVGTLPIGNISCNELGISLQNIEDHYSVGNTDSLFSNLAVSNRRIEPYIGFVIHNERGQPVNTEYVPKGVFWTRDWNVSLQGTTASTSALDRMGLLQEIEYNGIGNIDNPEAVAEETYWENTSLYTLLYEILDDLRITYMRDLEFQIDDELKSIIISLAFFPKKSYFDIIKTISQAAVSYAYMDIPTDEERATAAIRGVDCADILRIKRVDELIPVGGFVIAEEMITLDDIIEQSIQAKREDMVNVVRVPWGRYEVKEGKPEPLEDEETQFVTVSNPQAIKEYGRIEYEFEGNNLIQTEQQARHIANTILGVFSTIQRTCEINTFGDVTNKIGTICDIPEYRKNGIDSRGHYAITRISTEFDGGLRQSLLCRRVGDVVEIEEFSVIEELGHAKTNIIGSGRRQIDVVEGE